MSGDVEEVARLEQIRDALAKRPSEMGLEEVERTFYDLPDGGGAILRVHYRG